MKVSFNTNKYVYLSRYNTVKSEDCSSSNIDSDYASIDYTQIPFGAIYNVKPKRMLDCELEKKKLLKQITEILSSDSDCEDPADLFIDELSRVLSVYRHNFKRQLEIVEELERIQNDKRLNDQQRVDLIRGLSKELQTLEKMRIAPKKKASVNSKDEKIDYPLINKFKSAIEENNFDLAKVFYQHYDKLNEIETVEELHNHYPHIKIPQRPEKVISKKIVNTLTRDFFESMHNFVLQGDRDNFCLLTDDKVKEILSGIAQKFNIKEEVLQDKLLSSVRKAVVEKYTDLVRRSGLNSVPEAKKVKTPQVTDNDIRLLFVDFDDFVLSVLRQQYLKSEKLSNITYSNQYFDLPVSVLKEPEYKFDKLSEKIKKMISSAKMIREALRDYDNFDVARLKACLTSYFDNGVISDQRLLEKILDFASCTFEEEDVKQLIKFLRGLDEVSDGNKSVDNLLELIAKDDIRPKGTEQRNAIEQKKALEKIKLDQKKAFELSELKHKFDEAINFLYMENMNKIALLCGKYRPDSLDSADCHNAKFIIQLITDNINLKKQGKPINKFKLENTIMRWDTFNTYRTSNADSEIFKNAIKYGKQPDGSINTDLAGKYIINYEIARNYPESLQYVQTPAILSLIMNKTGNNFEKAVKYLCKFDDYQDLTSLDKTYLTKFIEMFDLKDPVEKLLLKHVIENEYSKVDTCSSAKMYASSEDFVPATIAAVAKQQIMAKYKYPTCLEYLEGFEEALSKFATTSGTSGMKKVDRNNKSSEYTLELKLTGYGDRLLCKDNSYYFDIFSSKGLH